jgi:hypothetical protein
MVLPSAPIGALMARIGDGDWFLVGSHASFSAPRSGQLVFAFNDRASFYTDNSRSIEGTVSIQ